MRQEITCTIIASVIRREEICASAVTSTIVEMIPTAMIRKIVPEKMQNLIAHSCSC